MTANPVVHGALFIATVWGLSHGIAEAKAAPGDDLKTDAASVCTALDADASLNGFHKALLPIVLSNIAPDDVVEMLDYAITVVCPRHQGDLARATDELERGGKLDDGFGAHEI